MEGKHEAARAPRKNHRRSGAGMTALKVLGTLLAIGVCTALMFFGIFMKYVHTTLEPVLDVDMSAITLNQSSVIYYQDKSTGEWKELQKIHGTEDRTNIEFSDIPDHVWQALVSIEDQRFFQHHGVDWKSTGKAVFTMLTGGGTQRGGSTITQQVIKNATGNNQPTIKRKVTEIFQALRFYKNYSREETLTFYLNLVYFGNHSYGIQAAAENYFGKDAKDLTVAEGAAIVGITQYPYLYDPSRQGGRRRCSTRCTSSAIWTTRNTRRRSTSRWCSCGMTTMCPPAARRRRWLRPPRRSSIRISSSRSSTT